MTPLLVLGLWSVLCADADAERLVPPPTGLLVRALNTDYTLVWTWSGPNSTRATFTVEYIGKFKADRENSRWYVACEETAAMLCDLNPLDLHYLGIYTLRVRASVLGGHSEWTQVDFLPAEDAAVGPPSIKHVSALGPALEVSISEPQTNRNVSMRDKIQSLFFRFQFWERDTEPTGRPVPYMDQASSVVVLERLKSWTWYCVRVQSRTREPNRTSSFTRPCCARTQGEFRWGRFIWIFLLSMFLLVLVFLGIILGGFYCRRNLQRSLVRPVFINQTFRFPALLLTSGSENCDLLSVRSSPQDQDHSRNSSTDSGTFTSPEDHEEESAKNLLDLNLPDPSTKNLSDQSTESLRNIPNTEVQEET